MSLADFQHALADLIASPELCLRVRSSRADALTDYELTAREQRRLVDVAGQPGMSVSCTLYRVNRITPLYSLLPRSCALLGDRLTGQVTAFWELAATDLQYLPEIERFAEFLGDGLERGELDSPYLREILEFEQALNALRLAPRERSLATVKPAAANPRWRLSPLVRVVRFVHEPGPLLSALAAGAPPAVEPSRGEFHLLVTAADAEFAVNPVGPKVGRLLADAARQPCALPADETGRALVDAGLVVPA